MIMNGWLDWAERVDGHPEKVYSEPCRGEFLVGHSIVGWLPNHAIPQRFLSNDRLPNGMFTPNAAASVKWIGYDDGHLIQMYPIEKATWTSGSRGANTAGDAIEEEGGAFPEYGEKLSKPAEDTFVRLFTELEAYHGWDSSRPQDYLKQHKDMRALYGSDATACASDRYSNAWARITAGERYEDMGMSDTDILAVFGSTERDANGNLDYAARLAAAKDRYQVSIDTGHSPFDLAAQIQADLKAHETNHTGGGGGGPTVPDHIHEPGVVSR